MPEYIDPVTFFDVHKQRRKGIDAKYKIVKHESVKKAMESSLFLILSQLPLTKTDVIKLSYTDFFRLRSQAEEILETKKRNHTKTKNHGGTLKHRAPVQRF